MQHWRTCTKAKLTRGPLSKRDALQPDLLRPPRDIRASFRARTSLRGTSLNTYPNPRAL